MPKPGTAQSRVATMASAQMRARTSNLFSGGGDSTAIAAPAVGVFANEWTRETTETGKVYFFNKSTGASQWHIPNDVYKSRFFNPDKILAYTKKDETVPPSVAHAMLGVDCMMEVAKGLEGRELRDSMVTKFHHLYKPAAEAPPVELPPLEETRVLRVTVVQARGLRDADFMPGSDKSDPYCKCEIMGKPEATFRTPVIRDCLDPVWNHTELVPGYEEGDALLFSVYDEDDVSQNRNASSSYMNDGPSQMFLDGDEQLGRLMISDDEVIRESHAEYQLEDAGKGIEAFLEVELRVVSAFPGAMGMSTSDALLEIKRVRKDCDIVAYEVPHEPGEVVSFDPLHMKQGYTGSFFGVFEEQAVALTPGCSVTVGNQTLVVDHVGESDPKHQVRGSQVVYVHLSTPIKGVIRNKTKWTKALKQPEPGFNEKRIILWYDCITHEVARLPHIG